MGGLYLIGENHKDPKLKSKLLRLYDQIKPDVILTEISKGELREYSVLFDCIRRSLGKFNIRRTDLDDPAISSDDLEALIGELEKTMIPSYSANREYAQLHGI